MAIKTYYRCLSGNGEREMTMQEFKRRTPGRDSGHWRVVHQVEEQERVRSADVNGDGFIDVHEIENLVEFAKTHLRVKIVEF
ncbi:hypothetical protein AAG906_030553 [Vitis piasezkii]